MVFFHWIKGSNWQLALAAAQTLPFFVDDPLGFACRTFSPKLSSIVLSISLSKPSLLMHLA